ncbi:MAG: Carboxyl transferase [candidate division TM6 bacterium GW2011_GWF2_38_10]|nr:MAG: Carboxyl transferase [candidate division TM6 bacterium GW2011_GWF2_38_10]
MTEIIHEEIKKRTISPDAQVIVEKKDTLNNAREIKKMRVRERLDLLLDAHSFQEWDHLAVSSIIDKKEITDGVITGFGTINKRKVAIYAQDFSIKGGSLGKRHAEKICKIMDMAVKVGCPIIGIIDSGGARIDEGIHALAGYGSIFARNARYSGIVPQISLILGPCAGGATYSPSLTDFIFTTQGISNLFITGPQVIEKALHQKITKEALGGAMVHAKTSGVAHFVAQTEADCFQMLKQLFEYLPNNYLDDVSMRAYDQTLEYPDPCDLVPANFSQSYSIKRVIQALVDADSFFEVHELFAANMVTGFAFMGGRAVGIVANQPSVKAGTIDIDASCKAARFIRFCDCFGLPVVTLVDVPGYLAGVDQEHQGIIRHGAKLLYAYATATVPKITVVLRKAFGGAYIAMGSKDLGADVNAAWPQAQIAVLAASAAVQILHAKKIAAAPQDEQAQMTADLTQHYEETFLNPTVAAQAGYIDAIIKPSDTRKFIIDALAITASKIDRQLPRKHGNIPL